MMTFQLEGEKEARPPVRAELCVDEDGDLLLNINGVCVLFISATGKLHRYALPDDLADQWGMVLDSQRRIEVGT